jgi:hypothetical protein
VSHDEFGEKLGRIHMKSQDFAKLELKKTKSTKLLRKRGGSEISGGRGAEADSDAEGSAAAGAGRPGKRARLAADEDADEI